MTLTLSLQASVKSCAMITPRSLHIAATFGLSLDHADEQLIIPPIHLTLAPGQIIFITGVSGGGKSTLLRRIKQSLCESNQTSDSSPSIVSLDLLPALPDLPLVDALAKPTCEDDDDAPAIELERVCRWLSLAGLNDAAVMLRKPSELSDGQRHRLSLAQAFATTQQQHAAWSVLLADEFCSLLDRTTAHALAQSTRRWITQTNLCLVAATAHDDLLEALNPDVLVDLAPGGLCSVHQRPN